ncbi:MAG: ankyrin repeat domain-containing protein [Flavobacteriaceae bacterium]
MRKTIFLMAATCLFATICVKANDLENQHELVMSTSIEKLELSSFCKAIMQGDIDTVQRMISLGEDINRKSLGMTPAIFAARYNKAEILELLIEHGADLSIRSDKGYTIKKYAEMSNAKEALAVLDDAT